MRKSVTHTDRVLHVHVPRVLVETAVAHGAPRDALLERSDLTSAMLADPDTRVSYLQLGILSGNALHFTKDPLLGLHVGHHTGIAQMGALGFLLQSSPTLGAALDAAIRYNRSFAPGWDFGVEVKGPVATITFPEVLSMEPFRVFAHEIILAALHTQATALYGGPTPVRRVRLPFPEPAHAHEYRRLLYDVPFLFDQAVGSMDVDAGLLNSVIAFADPATLKLAEHYCARVMPVDASQDGLVSQMRRLLDIASGIPPSLEQIAQTLKTSTRSLRRELRNMNTSYKELLDESRRLRAEAWMETNSLPLERLATGLGFSHVRSFRRAFKRWTGRTPSASRGRSL